MRLVLIVEVMILLVIGFFSLAEGIRLTIGGKLQLYDVLGPGLYNIGMGLILILVGIIYLISQIRQPHEEKTESSSLELKIKTLSMMVALVIYTVLMNFIGYLLSSLVFFLLITRIAGFKSWKSNILIGGGMTVSFYLVFVKWLNMIFPRGTLVNF